MYKYKKVHLKDRVDNVAILSNTTTLGSWRKASLIYTGRLMNYILDTSIYNDHRKQNVQKM